MAKIKYRVMDTDNAGIEWGPWQEAKIEEDPDTLDASQMALKLNCLNWESVSEDDGEDDGEDDPAPGDLENAAGDGAHGIAWFEDRGHQGETSLIFEWHQNP